MQVSTHGILLHSMQISHCGGEALFCKHETFLTHASKFKVWEAEEEDAPS